MDSNNGQESRETVSEKDAAATSLLNQFILGQLKERQCSNGEIRSQNGFVLPKLQLGNAKPTNFVIPPLKLSHANGTLAYNAKVPPIIISRKTTDEKTSGDGIGEISSGVNNMQVNDSETLETKIPSTIDLTTALSSATGIIVKSKQRVSTPAEDFQIPFIECDRREKPIILPVVNNYCQLSTYDNFLCKGKVLTAPSSCGRVICLNYKRIHPLPKISHSFKVKHKIQRFRFDTKSPDDIILATLNKYHRQY
ncbi:uncharacterized protein LOC129238934 [Anastrepha obliqua]|uniref:uncharacterized protein LOC129238934 n=1 Tax=Anastrepha obliqua TaxID=95512 RepID=UPI00240A1A4C|nr:uncharacterized protein LOC129238934 [Anastrepha obliqua]